MTGERICPSVAAIRSFVPAWSRGRLSVAIDSHGPWIRGSHNEVIWKVRNPDPAMWQRQVAFGKVLEEVQSGPLKYRAADNLPFGRAWNTGENYGDRKNCSAWAAKLEGTGPFLPVSSPFSRVFPNSASAAYVDVALVDDGSRNGMAC